MMLIHLLAPHCVLRISEGLLCRNYLEHFFAFPRKDRITNVELIILIFNIFMVQYSTVCTFTHNCLNNYKTSLLYKIDTTTTTSSSIIRSMHKYNNNKNKNNNNNNNNSNKWKLKWKYRRYIFSNISTMQYYV